MKIDLIYRRYKELFIVVVLSGFLFISGCAGGGTEVGNPTSAASEMTAPSISNLAYAPESSAFDSGGGEIIVTGSVEFEDNDGDVSNIIIDIIDSEGNQIEQITESIEEFSGDTSGIIEFILTIDTQYQDIYTFEVYIMDKSNNESNVLIGEVSVI